MGHMTSLQVGTVAERDAQSLLSVVSIKGGQVNIDPAAIAAGDSAEVAVTITGVQVGDVVLFEAPAAFEAGLTAHTVGRVSAVNTVQLRITNVTAAPINGAVLAWRYLWLGLD